MLAPVMGGFEFAETMSGTFERADGAGSGHVAFDLVVTAPSLWAHLRDRKCRVSGTIDVDGLADASFVTGEMILAPFWRRLIRYDFSFFGDDRRAYRFAGQKNIKISNLRETLSTLPATITDASGRLVARATVRFDVDADLPAFLASWRATGSTG